MKVGDRVKCINNTNSSLILYKIYTVRKIMYNGNELLLEEMGESSNFFSSRFKVVTISDWGFENVS